MPGSNCVSRGVWYRNPVFVLALGLCPALAVTTTLETGLGMGIATTAVLVFSNTSVSLLRNIIPANVRLPAYITIIATFVTIVGMLLEAFYPVVYSMLGIYVPLIVVNCLVLGRAEAFAKRNPPKESLLDGLGMGLGFLVSLAIIGAVREILSTGSLVGLRLGLPGAAIMMLPAGALFTIGLIIAAINFVNMVKK